MYDQLPGLRSAGESNNPGARYVICRRMAADIVAGDVVALDPDPANNVIGKPPPVKRTTMADDENACGIVAAIDRGGGVGSEVIVQVSGLHQSASVDGTTDLANGDQLSTFTTAGALKKATNNTAAIATFCDAAYTTNAVASKAVFIRDRFGLARI